MYKFSVLIVTLLAISAVNGGKLSKSDPMALLDEIINQANLDIAKENKSVLSGADFSLNYWIGTISLKNSYAGNFSSIALVGDDQVFNLTDLDEEGKMFKFDIKLGLEELYIQSDLYYSFLIPFVNSRVKISDANLGLRVAGSIVSKDTCNANLDTAELTGLGDFEVTFTPSGITTFIPKHIIQFFLNTIAPIFKSYVNSKINTIIQEDEVKSAFVAQVCKPFVKGRHLS